MAIEAGDFKTGLTVIVDGDPWQVIEFMHVKPGKGAAILRTKMRNLKTGSTQERNFNASTKFEAAPITKQLVTFSYAADGIYSFMDMETFETYELTEEQMVMINGGGSDTDCSSSPNHSHDWVYLHASRPGSFFGEFWPDYLYECKHCGKQDWRWT